MHVKVRHVIEHAGGPGTVWKSDVQEVGTTHIPEPEGGTRIGCHAGDLDIAELDIAYMTQIEMLRRQRTKAGRLGVVIRPFGRFQPRHLSVATAPVQEAAIADLDILNGMTGNTTDDRGHLISGSIAGDIADQYSLEPADRDPAGSTHARAQAQENRCVANVSHGNSDHCDVFHDAAIDGLQREASAALEDAVGDGDVAEPTIRL